MTFNVGDKVTWTSQSAGTFKTKTGEVKRVIPTGVIPDEINNPGMSRKHVSYLVRAGGRWYWPRVAALASVSATPNADHPEKENDR